MWTLQKTTLCWRSSPPFLCWGTCCAFLALGTLLSVSNDKGRVALLPLTSWSTRRSSFVQDSPNAPSVTLKSFISSTSQRSSKSNRSNGKKGHELLFCIHIYIYIYIYKKMYTETETERQPFSGWCWNTLPPPKHPNLSNPPHQKQHLQSPAKGVLIFATGILLLRCFRSPKKWEKSRKTMGKKKFVDFLILMEKGSASHLS